MVYLYYLKDEIITSSFIKSKFNPSFKSLSNDPFNSFQITSGHDHVSICESLQYTAD